MDKMRLLALALAIALGLTACSGGNDRTTAPSEPLSESPRASTSVDVQEENSQAESEGTSANKTSGMEEAGSIRIRLTVGDTVLTVGDTVLTATLRDNETTRDFVSLLPLTLTLEDYAGTEKISYLPKKLSTVGAPSGSDPSVGDITYYAPWGNLAIFYRDFGYSDGLVVLGQIDSGMEGLNVPGSIKVTVELID